MSVITPQFIPSLSQAGAASLATSANIPGKQRQLLRLIDGKRSLAQISIMMPGRDLVLELGELRQQGFLAQAPRAETAAPSAAATLPAHWHEASAYMQHQALESLGVMSHPIILLLEKVRDAAAARTAVARWHMALRESRNSRETANTHLEHVTDLLEL